MTHGGAMMSTTSRFELTDERLGWAAMGAIAAIGSVSFIAVMIALEHYWPQYSIYGQAVGHLIITLAVIMIVRQFEQRAVIRDRDEIVNAIVAQHKELTEKSLPQLESANMIGLARIHQTRAAAKRDLDEAIKGTRKTLLMVGVALHETISIEEKCGQIADMVLAQQSAGSGPHPVDRFRVRFLCLNPHTTPGRSLSPMPSWSGCS